MRYDDVVQALADTKISSILLALSSPGLAFWRSSSTTSTRSNMSARSSVPHVALTAFSAYAVGNTAGFGALSAGAIRYRAYSRHGLTPEEITRVIAFVTLSFGLGLAAVGAIALLSWPTRSGR